jgi:hypothetical protein
LERDYILFILIIGYKWQIQIKTSNPNSIIKPNDDIFKVIWNYFLLEKKNKMNKFIFKIFSWRLCDKNEYSMNASKIKPIKCINSTNSKVQVKKLFQENFMLI